MAIRRMFSKTITSSSKFLRMPASSRLLYYDLGMNADDDGFVEWYTVITMTKSSEQDLQVLQGNQFIQIFDEKVLIVLDWKENNYLRSDRYMPSKYAEQYKHLLGKDLVYQLDTTGIPDGRQSATQDRLGQDRLGKDRIDKVPVSDDTGLVPAKEGRGNSELNDLIAFAKDHNFPAQGSLKENRQYAWNVLRKHGLERTKQSILAAAQARGERYAPNITDFKALFYKFGDLETFYQRQVTTAHAKKGVNYDE